MRSWSHTVRLLVLVALGGHGTAVVTARAEAPATQGPTTAPAAPRTSETQATPGGHLGTLPDGVGVAVGHSAPDATVVDVHGAPVELKDLWAAGPILLVFYRGGWCPFCNFQVRELTTAYSDFKSRGVTPVLVSVDRIEESAHTQATYAIPFPVLSDSELVAHSAYKVMHQVGDEENKKLRDFGLDLEQASGRKHNVIAIPAIFVIDEKGVVRWAHADLDYKVRPSVIQILDVLDTLGWHR